MVLRAVLVGVILCVAAVFVHGQTVRDTVGPLEKSATQSSPENPIPRRLSAPPAARVQEWPSPGRGGLRLQVTLDTSGRVAEIRRVAEPLVQLANGVPLNEPTRLAIGSAMLKSAAASVSQWTYEPPRAPITFFVAFTFYSNADPVAVQDPTPATRSARCEIPLRAACAARAPVPGCRLVRRLPGGHIGVAAAGNGFAR